MYTSIQKTTMTNKGFVEQLYGSDLVDYLKCDRQTWPICLFDFSYQIRLPQFFTYRTRDFPGYIDENYFQEDEEVNKFNGTPKIQNHSRVTRKNVLIDDSKQQSEDSDIPSEDSVIFDAKERKLVCQRNCHYCNPNLIRMFKRLIKVDSE